MNIQLSQGNVGIGTTTPSQALSVQGNTTMSGAVFAGSGLGMFRNRIINGDMRIDQRNSGSLVTNISDNVYVLDRFAIGKAGSLTINAQQVPNVPDSAGFKNSIQITVGTQQTTLGVNDYALLIHRIEGNNMYDLMWGTAYAQPITISFWIYTSNTATFTLGIRNGSYDRSYVVDFTVVANGWRYNSITIPGPTTGSWNTETAMGMVVMWCFGAGSNYHTTAGSWNNVNRFATSSTTNYFANSVGSSIFITGIQLEKGTTATPFEFRPLSVELALCQRYYQVLSAASLALYLGDGNTFYVSFPFITTMRATPSLTETTYSQSNNAATWPRINPNSSSSYNVEICTAWPGKTSVAYTLKANAELYS